MELLISWPDLPWLEEQCCLTALRKPEKLLAPVRVGMELGVLDATGCWERKEVIWRLLGVNL